MDENWCWEMWHGEKYLGLMVLDKRDFPWFNCIFTSTPEFEAGYRALFDREYTLIRADQRGLNGELWVDYYETHIEALHLIFRPQNTDTPRIEVRLIHIQGDKAWFRPTFPDRETGEDAAE